MSNILDLEDFTFEAPMYGAPNSMYNWIFFLKNYYGSLKLVAFHYIPLENVDLSNGLFSINSRITNLYSDGITLPRMKEIFKDYKFVRIGGLEYEILDRRNYAVKLV